MRGTVAKRLRHAAFNTTPFKDRGFPPRPYHVRVRTRYKELKREYKEFQRG